MRKWIAIVAVVVVALSATAWFTLRAVGLVSNEHHIGYFAPVWSSDGRFVYYLERETTGRVWGMGWEFFSAPAHVRAARDTFRLCRVDAQTGATEILDQFAASPLVGRTVRNYRGRIFCPVSARIEPTAAGAEYTIQLSIPRQPTSEVWSLKGTWSGQTSGVAAWTQDSTGGLGLSEDVLRGGQEVMAVPGVESYPSAIVAVDEASKSRALLHNDEYDALYPDGVSATLLAERSNREQIERVREIRRVRAELVERFTAEGMSEGDALLRAGDELENLGLYPKSPRLVATKLDAVPGDVPVFEISRQRFDVGLFTDIAEAILRPGAEVKTSTGSYLKYADDDTGVRLREWRESGQNRFCVATDGEFYLLEVRRFEP